MTRNAVNAQPSPRGLVHLIDAQIAVQSQLTHVKGVPHVADSHSRRLYRRRYCHNNEEGLEEEGVDREEKKNSILFAYGETICDRADNF